MTAKGLTASSKSNTCECRSGIKRWHHRAWHHHRKSFITIWDRKVRTRAMVSVVAMTCMCAAVTFVSKFAEPTGILPLVRNWKGRFSSRHLDFGCWITASCCLHLSDFCSRGFLHVFAYYILGIFQFAFRGELTSCMLHGDVVLQGHLSERVPLKICCRKS